MYSNGRIWRLKGCPACRGDLYVTKPQGLPALWACLQCGREYLSETPIERGRGHHYPRERKAQES